MKCVYCTLLLDVSSIFFATDLSFVASSLLNSSGGLMPGFLVVLLQFFAFSLKLRKGGGGGGGGIS